MTLPGSQRTLPRMCLEPDAAWEAARRFASELASKARNEINAVYVVGSLAEGAFQPQHSGIDVTSVFRGRVVGHDLELAVAGTRSTMGADLARRIRCVMLCEENLTPPYPPEREVLPEVMRVQDEGVLVVGDDIRDRIVRPSRDEVIAYIRHVDRVVRDSILTGDDSELPPPRELFSLAVTACRHYIFVRDHLWIWTKRDVLLAFCMGHEEHPSTPVVRELARDNGMTAAGAGSQLGRRVTDLWRVIHREIAA